MSFIQLGKSDIQISKIIMGTWQAGKQMWTGIEDSDSIEAIKVAYDNGITTFDTAELYGKGHSEQIIGKSLKNVRDKVVIATKVAPQNLSPQKIRSACERSLKNLHTDYIDLYQIHWPAGSFGSKKIPIEESLGEMTKLKKEGKIRSIGVSNFSLDQVKEALLYAEIDSVQSPYSILWRHIEKDIQSFCIENNITLLAYSSMAQGLLTGKFKKDHKFDKGDHRKSNILFSEKYFERSLDFISKIKPIAADLGMTLGGIAIYWVLTHENTAAIAGARNAKQSFVNANVLGCRLPHELMKELEALSSDIAEELIDQTIMWQ